MSRSTLGRALVASAAFLLSAAAGLVTALGGSRTALQPAAPGEPSYRLSSLSISYPLAVDTDGGTKVDDTMAGVTYRATWTIATFPGEAQCEIRLLDAGGAQVGATTIGVVSLVPEPAFIGTRPVPVEVSRAPASAEATCATAQRPTGGYVVTNPRVVPPPPDGSPGVGADLGRIIGDVSWKGGAYPGTAACHADLAMKDGSQHPVDFSLEVPEGDDAVLTLVPPEWSAATSVEVSCGPYT